MCKDAENIKLYIDIVKKFKKIKIAVLGDFILDKYIWGTCSRISPEAPVPILESKSTEYRLGGAGNVAANLSSLGCMVDTFGVIGNDNEGAILTNLLNKLEINSFLIESITDRKTSLKTRVIADTQQIVRIDEETNKEISIKETNVVIKQLLTNIEQYDALIISDYLKGVITPRLTKKIISSFRKRNKIVIVDPKGLNYNKYSGATAITPNFNEFKLINKQLNMKQETEILGKYAMKLKNRLNLEGVIITLGSNGVYIQNNNNKIIPTRAKEVFDVSGAGDTFIALFTAAFAVHINWFIAGEIANHGAGIIVGKTGTSILKVHELINSLQENN